MSEYPHSTIQTDFYDPRKRTLIHLRLTDRYPVQRHAYDPGVGTGRIPSPRFAPILRLPWGCSGLAVRLIELFWKMAGQQRRHFPVIVSDVRDGPLNLGDLLDMVATPRLKCSSPI